MDCTPGSAAAAPAGASVVGVEAVTVIHRLLRSRLPSRRATSALMRSGFSPDGELTVPKSNGPASSPITGNSVSSVGAVGAVAGTMAGNALAGNSGDKDAKAAKEAQALAAEKEAQELQRKADEAKARAAAARSAAQ